MSRPLPASLLERVQQLPPFFATPLVQPDSVDLESQTFDFLNKSRHFASGADWGFKEEGLLWNYHLNSFMWLERLEGPHAAATALLQSRAMASSSKNAHDGYPTSRRLLHGMRFLLMGEVRAAEIITLFWKDAQYLYAFPEKHVGANHLLENYIALWAAGSLFHHAPFFKKATDVLLAELPRQFGTDGGHYERSTHYTAQLLGGLLRCLEMSDAVRVPPPPKLRALCHTVIAGGLGWLQQMQWDNGEMPSFGDAHRTLWPTLDSLLEAAGKQGISPLKGELSQSGYRKLENATFSLRANVGEAMPRFQPGHSHADALSFTLSFRGAELITDVGISTYERNTRRQWERSTAAHNTIEVAGQNSAEVWAAFRMGRRAGVKLLKSTNREIAAEHLGYRHLSVVHRREFCLSKEALEIRDILTGNPSNATLRLYFPPGTEVLFLPPKELLAGECTLYFEGLKKARLETYEWAAGFNKTIPATCFSAQLSGNVSTLIFKAATLGL